MDENTLNDLLECSVCLERLDTSSKVLPCQHTFCRKCLEVIVSSRQELRCPECRVLVEVKIDDLPPNVLLMRILEGMKNAAAAAKSQQQPTWQPKSNQNIRQVNDSQHQQQMFGQLQQLQQNQHTQHQYKPNSLVQQQQQSQPQLNLVNHNSNNVAHQFTQQQFIQQRRCLLPHAYALYDFESSEPTDLHFKKGDLVLLKRKVDSNWYVGQLNNGNGVVSEGTFPINHVQVVVPLPTPQCIALYDFKMPPNEEQGCLTFKKGTVIHVLRRVDHNWAEGCIGTTIGIFPIAFVELNALAKQVLDAGYIVANTPTVSSTSTPNMTTATVTVPSSTSAGTSVQQILMNQLRNPLPLPIIDTMHSDSTTSPSSPSTSSSNATSPHSVSTTTTTATSSAVVNGGGASSTSMPSSPNHSLPASPLHEVTTSNIGSGSSSVRFRDKREKRHSLNALLSAGTLHTGLGTGVTLSILQSNRHSAEILSIPSDTQTSSEVGRSSSSKGNAIHDTTNAMSTVVPETSAAREQQQQLTQPQNIQQKQQQQQQSHQRVNVLKTSVAQQHLPPTLPWGYLALYPYKPRKNDELELKKGCVYIVTERCLDGWFKGKNWQDITGVFPGNYVTPLRSRDQQQLIHQWKYVPPQSANFSQQANVTSNSSNCIGIQSTPVLASTSQRIQNLHQPPDLPPRQVSSTLQISSVWTKPLGHTVEAFFNRYSKTHETSKDQSEKGKYVSRQKENASSVSPNAAAGPTSSPSTSSAVQLMKLLAHIKSGSKAPGSAMTRQQQESPHSQLAPDKPKLDDTVHNCNKSAGGHSIQNNNLRFNTTTQSGQLHPVHVRSGSCPSQFLQSSPHDQTASTSSVAGTSTMTQIQEHASPQHTSQQKHQQQNVQQSSIHAVGYGSQQLRGPKERPHLQNERQSMDAANWRVAYNSSVAQQQQQNSVNTPNCAGEQQKQLHSSIISNHRKSHSLDASAVLSSANTEYGASGNNDGGEVTLGAPCNVTAAAVAASATTKSTQSSRESRFRCVVPYPPNSDIELELQVGDIIYVQRRQKNGWYKGTHARTNKTGLFPASFVEPDI